MQKIFDFNAGTYVYIEDTVSDFWTRQAEAPIPHARPITCVVCRRAGLSDPERPALCVECGSDLPVARGFVVNLVLASERRVEQTMDAWHTAHTALDPATLARFQAYEAARTAGDGRAAAVETMARTGRADALLSAVRLWLDYQDAGERYTEAQAWVKRCEEVLG